MYWILPWHTDNVRMWRKYHKFSINCCLFRCSILLLPSFLFDQIIINTSCLFTHTLHWPLQTISKAIFYAVFLLLFLYLLYLLWIETLNTHSLEIMTTVAGGNNIMLCYIISVHFISFIKKNFSCFFLLFFMYFLLPAKSEIAYASKGKIAKFVVRQRCRWKSTWIQKYFRFSQLDKMLYTKRWDEY